MEEITLIGLDRFDNNCLSSFLCSGVLLHKLNCKINLIYSKKYEQMDKSKYEFLKNLSNFNIYDFDSDIKIDEIKNVILNSKTVIFNPMEYNLPLLDKLKNLNVPLQINFSYFSAKNKDLASFSENIDNVLIISRHNHELKRDLANKIVTQSRTNCIIFKSYGVVDVYSHDGFTYTYKLFLDEVSEEFYTYSNIFFTGFIYGQINKKSTEVSSHIGLALCDMAKDKDKTLDDDKINLENLNKAMKNFSYSL